MSAIVSAFLVVVVLIGFGSCIVFAFLNAVRAAHADDLFGAPEGDQIHFNQRGSSPSAG